MPGIQTAVDRLESQLPLRRRQQALPDGIARAHRAILRSIAATGQPPEVDQLERIARMDAGTVIDRLCSDDLLVAEGRRIEGAYPFSLEPTPHVMTIAGLEIHAMCALDAVAVAPVFGIEVATASQCAVTGRTIRIRQVGRSVEMAEPDALRIGVRWQQPEGCAAHSMCREMVFLSDSETAEHWRGADPDGAGIFDLDEAIEFGVGFFGPLIDESLDPGRSDRSEE
jgi:mercuric reductase